MKIALLVLACVAASQAKFQYAFATPYHYGYAPWSQVAAYPAIDAKFAAKVDTKTPASTFNAPAFYSAWPYGYSAAAYPYGYSAAAYPYGFGYQYFTNQFPAAAAAAAPFADAPAAVPADASNDNKESQVVEAAPVKEETASRKKRDLAYYTNPYVYPYAYAYPPFAGFKSVVAPAAYVAPAALTREATLTKTVLNPGHAVAYRVD